MVSYSSCSTPPPVTRLPMAALITFTIAVAIIDPSCCVGQDRPNLVLFLADDCTYRDIGAYGSPNPTTPTLDRLALQGMKFNRCYQASSMCSPTRHNLFNGRYPVRSGAHPNHTFADNSVKGMPHYLKQLGYRVAFIGKWHIGPKEVYPFEYLADKVGGEDYLDLSVVSPLVEKSKQSGQPFCLIVCSHQPHGPYTVGDPSHFPADEVRLRPNMVDTPQTREVYSKYLAEIEFMDGQVGTVLDMLDDQQVSSNTLFIYLSEQGSSFPLSKWTCYEDGVRSAMIARWPKVIKAGTETDALVEYNDILPTFIAAAGGKAPKDLDGTSLLPIFTNPNHAGKRYAFSIQTTRGIIQGSEYYGVRAVTDGSYRYIYNISPEMQFQNGFTRIRSKNHWWGSWRHKAETDATAAHLVNQYLQRPAEELYDLQSDPDNLNNLASDPALVKIKAHMKAALFDWMEYCGDEGLKTELLAYQRMKAKRANSEPVCIYILAKPLRTSSTLPASKADPAKEFTGYILIPRDGYYTFYKKQGAFTQVTVADVVVVPQHKKALYGIIGLKKGAAHHLIRARQASQSESHPVVRPRTQNARPL